MRSLSIKFVAVLLLVVLWSCGKEEDDNNPLTHNYTWDFESGAEEWTAGFSDYPADWDEDRFEFRFEHSDLPEEVRENSGSLLISGRNYSDDLFMFIKRKMAGLKPDQTYLLSFETELASRYPTESVGIGGSPGSSVFLKAGGSATEPQPVTEEGEVRMNIDKGNQSKGGAAMQVIGNVGIPGDEFVYQLIRRDNFQNPLSVKSDASGNLWIILGTDSGFEGTTTLYFNQINVRLEEAQ